jgi:propionyl-CoA carboxylase alpha chain
LAVLGVRRWTGAPRAGADVFIDTAGGSVTLTELSRLAPPAVELAAGSLVAPLPGAVSKVHVTVGQRVAAGELMLTLEAMKLEHPVLAPVAGTVAELPVPPGAQVDGGAVLAVVSPSLEDPQ